MKLRKKMDKILNGSLTENGAVVDKICAFILIDARKSAIYFMKKTEGYMILCYIMKTLHNKFK